MQQGVRGQITNVTAHQAEHREDQISVLVENQQTQPPVDIEGNSLETQCFKIGTYKFDVGKCVRELYLDTLLNTVSPISFVKECCVPATSMKSCSQRDRKYNGINNSELVKLGIVKINVILDNVEREVELYVVPNETMCSQVVLGRDALKKFNLGLKALSPLEAEAVENIFNIDICVNDHINCLNINPEIDLKIQSSLRNLFSEEYEYKERPESPNIKTQLHLQLTNNQPIFIGPRRLSFKEKEELQKILDYLISRKIIRISNSPYASPIVMVMKKMMNIGFVSITVF